MPIIFSFQNLALNFLSNVLIGFTLLLTLGCSQADPVIGKAISTHQNIGNFIDERDGQTYKWVRLKDGKIWLAENLRYRVTHNSQYYENQPNQYGRLYTWSAAMIACPKGWHLASDQEWNHLITEYGDGCKVYSLLIDGGESQFSALLGGDRRPNGYYKCRGLYGSYWSSTSKNYKEAYCYDFFEPQELFHRDFGNKDAGYSCRCIRN